MEKQIVFEKLTPLSDSDISVYESAINFVFEEEDVKNVAISGAYGAGKSSVLESYKKKHRDLKFVHISLAHFQSHESEQDKTIKDSILEGKILNQLIHQISADRIPQTNFRVKTTVKKKSLLLNTGAIILLLLSMLLILNFNSWVSYVATLPDGIVRNILSVSTNIHSPLVGGLVTFIVLSYFIFQLVKLQKNKNIFRKFSVQGNEIEIFEETDDSYFDKYLNEVLYLFENVNADVIVFEDMDRFEANRIFERLREINTLINQQRQGKEKKVLRFFYLLRDDIFISKDRTKFFDCIIPVVPVVDSSNSYNQFIAHLKKNKLFEKFDESFLQGISLYVDDMRLLKNVCNEFLIYYNRLNTTELNYNKMLALTVYKNLFPRDFCDLQLNKGFVYALFAHKEDFIKEEIAAVEAKIKSLRERIETAEKERLESVGELDLVFKPRRNYWGELGAADKALYEKRKQALLDVKENRKEEMEQEIAELIKQKAALGTQCLAEIITRDNIDEIFTLSVTNEIGVVNEFKEIKGSDYFDLLKYLIRNGFIDETYADYMTYFYEDSLSRVDKIYLRSITDKKAKEYEYGLKSPQLVFGRLRPVDFDQEEALNFDLTTYLLQVNDASGCLDRLIEQLKRTKNFVFIRQYFDVSTEKTALTVRINLLWPEMFSRALTGAELSKEQLKEYSVLTLCNSSPDVIRAVNADGKLSDYISKLPDYLSIASPQVDQLIKAFKLIGVSFCSLLIDVSNTALFKKVYQEGLYNLSFSNIQLMLQCVYGFESKDDICHQNYTLILSNIQSPLHKKVLASMPEYMDIILENCNGRITDTEQTVREILNSDQIEANQKERYIELITPPIERLNAITDKTVWGALIMCEALLVTEENIMDYFLFKKKMEIALVKFINRAQEKLDYSNLQQYSAEERKQLFVAVVICNEIENSKYLEILTTLKFAYDAFDVEGIADDKMRILVDCSIIKMNAETLIFLRKHYAKTVLYFISKHTSEYVELMNNKVFSQDELLQILDWPVDDAIKLNLLKYSTHKISVVGKCYSVPVQCYILQNYLVANDMKVLFREYGSLDVEIKETVLDYAVNNIEQLIAVACNTHQELIQNVLKVDGVSKDDKVDLILALLPILEQSDMQKYLNLLELDEFVKIFDSRLRPKYEQNEMSTKILEAFRQKGWIFEYLEDEEKTGYYKIRRTPPKGKAPVKT